MPDPGTDGESLFSPLTVRKVDLPNRFVVPSMQRGMCSNFTPNARMRDYLVERIKGGFGLVITESCGIDHPAATNQTASVKLTAATKEAWRDVVNGVHAAGGKIFVQLWHEGAARHMHDEPLDAPEATVSPSGLVRRGTPSGRAASKADLRLLREAYVRSALLAKDVGFDGIELHGAHGYLLDQFLWHETNIRTDEYGGSELANRVRFPAEVAAAVRAAIGDAMPISFRFSQWKEIDFNAKVFRSPQELDYALTALKRAGVDMFNVSTRRFHVPEWPPSERTLAGWTRRLAGVPVIAVGGVGLDTEFRDMVFGPESNATPESSLSEVIKHHTAQEFDLVGVGRASIGDPNWVNKVKAKEFGAIRPFKRSDLVAVDWDLWIFQEGYHPDGSPRAAVEA